MTSEPLTEKAFAELHEKARRHQEKEDKAERYYGYVDEILKSSYDRCPTCGALALKGTKQCPACGQEFE